MQAPRRFGLRKIALSINPRWSDCTIFQAPLSRQTGEKVEKVHEKSSFAGSESGKSDDSLKGFRWEPVPNVFFCLLQKSIITPTEFAIFCTTWNFSRQDENKFKKTFSISRNKLSGLAGCCPDNAAIAMRLMVYLGLVKLSGQERGKVNKYSWIVDNFKTIQAYLTATQSTPDCHAVNYLTAKQSTPDCQTVTVYIPRFLDLINNSYKYFFEHNHVVDNSDSMGSERSGHEGPFTSYESMMTALTAAVEATWHLSGKGGTFPLHTILIVLKANLINPIAIRNPTALLLSLLKDQSVIYEAEKQFPNSFKSEQELLNYLDTKGVEQ